MVDILKVERRIKAPGSISTGRHKITLRAVTLLIFELQTSRSVQIDEHGALLSAVPTRAQDASRFGTRPVLDASYTGRVPNRARPEPDALVARGGTSAPC